MDTYVLDLGIVAFISWWQFAWWLSLVALYFVCNVVPAVLVLYGSVRFMKRWIDIFYGFEMFLLCLIPFIGSLIGCKMFEEWEPFEMVVHIVFAFCLISFIGMVVQGC